MVATAKLKKSVLNIEIPSVIIDKLNHWQKICLVIFLEIDKNIEIYLYYICLLLGLIVALQVKSIKNRYLVIIK